MPSVEVDVENDHASSGQPGKKEPEKVKTGYDNDLV